MDARVFTDLDALSRAALEELLRVMRGAGFLRLRWRGEPSLHPAGIIQPEGDSPWLFDKAADG
jgi:hypothetical protein